MRKWRVAARRCSRTLRCNLAPQPPKHVVIVGGSFAGLTAAYELKRDLGDRVRVTLIDRNDQFVFIPSLIWVPFGWRTPDQISFPLRTACERKGIEFRHAVATAIYATKQEVEVTDGSTGRTERLAYDYLLIATGPHVQFEAVPGVGPHGGYTESICTAEHAVRAGEAWTAFLKNPGPVIVGATQGSACYGAAYEFVFNLEYALRRAKVRDRVNVTYVTSEPFPGHFGIGGLKHAQGMTEWFFRHVKIDWAINSVLEKVTPGEVHFRAGQLHSATDEKAVTDLAGKSLPFRYAMIIPPFLGAAVVQKSGLGNDRGFVVTDDYFRHPAYPTVYAAGVAVAVTPPAPCEAGCSVPKTGYISEVMAHIAAKNIAASIEGKPLTSKPQADIDAKCILDAGNQGIIMYTDRVYAPKRRRWQTLIPGPWGHWAKLAFERYFLWKMRTGRVNWP